MPVGSVQALGPSPQLSCPASLPFFFPSSLHLFTNRHIHSANILWQVLGCWEGPLWRQEPVKAAMEHSRPFGSLQEPPLWST